MNSRRSPANAPARYQIRVRGALDPHWSEWFDGMEIGYDAGGDTLLIGLLADQAALYGVLHRIRDLGLILVAMAELPEIEDRGWKIEDGR
jgi:hypothetical protein